LVVSNSGGYGSRAGMKEFVTSSRVKNTTFLAQHCSNMRGHSWWSMMGVVEGDLSYYQKVEVESFHLRVAYSSRIIPLVIQWWD
jgi:hypothetical protein